MGLLFNKALATPDAPAAPPTPWDVHPGLAQLVASAERADPSLHLHSRDVAQLSLEIGKALNLSHGQLELLAFAAAVHDVGKLRVPRAVLAKPGPLDQPMGAPGDAAASR